MNAPQHPGSKSFSLVPGSSLAGYEIRQPLGAGGMGEVYRALDTRLGREVALKTIPRNARSVPEVIARFEQEARSASALNHPNIVTIYELGEDKGIHYIAMELVTGKTLREHLATGPLPFRKAIAIAGQVADALAKAHEAGIVHRDLKPDNIMFSDEGTAKVLDFGLAKLFVQERRDTSVDSTVRYPHTASGLAIGTVGYMSPEQANGAAVDFRSDQFSFGAVLYEMVCGLPAFRKKTDAETLAALLRDEPEQIAARSLQAPAPFTWIVERCLAKEPRQRYDSTRDLARDLAAVRDRMLEIQVVAIPRAVNLPVQRTTFIGRERELTALQQLLERDEVRLVTLTGPGGIGKTRLALEAASGMAPRFPGGIHFVSLSGVNQPDLAPSAIAQIMGVRETGKQPLRQTLGQHLAQLHQKTLLLLDNFEHLVPASALVSDLLSVAPQLKIVVTSQSPLHIYGEHEFPVTPLVLPDLKSISSPETLSRLPSVALFVERVQAVKPDFALTRENAAAVAMICARLDGLPLAIELAAARGKLLSPTAMLTRLENSLNLLTGGARDLPTRQQTLRGTLEWSYGLLNPAEQILFRRLAVFAAGCTLEGAEAVCDTKGDLSLDMLEGMSSMVDKSLVQQIEQSGGETRFVMLTTIREFARERLAESGEEAAVRRAHAAYNLVLAEEGESGGPEWLDRMEVEHDNVRAALDCLICSKDVEWAPRMGLALFRFWETREHLTEGRDFLERLLRIPGIETRPKLQARLLFDSAVLADVQAHHNLAQELFERSLEICVELNDNHGVVVAVNALAVTAGDRGDLATAALLFERCVAIWRDLGNPADIGRALSNLANVKRLQGEYRQAFALYGESRELFVKAGDESGVAWTLNHQGDVVREEGDAAAALSAYEKSLTAFQRLKDQWGIASVLSDLGALRREQGEYFEAGRLYGESLRNFQAVSHKRGVARVLECLAATAAAQHHGKQALQLAGAAAALRQRLGAPLPGMEQSRLDAALEPARQSQENAAGVAAWMEGWAMPLEEVVRAALEYSDVSSQPTSPISTGGAGVN